MSHKKKLVLFFSVLVLAAVTLLIPFGRSLLTARRIEAWAHSADRLEVRGSVASTLLPSSASSQPWQPISLTLSNTTTIVRSSGLLARSVRFQRVRRWDSALSSKAALSCEYFDGERSLGKVTIIAQDLIFLGEDLYVDAADDVLRSMLEVLSENPTERK